MNYKLQTPLRLSPIHDQLQSLKGTWREINGMPVLTTVPAVDGNLPVAIADLSYLTRFGVKGSGAIAWLAQQGIPIPAQPNSWCELPNGGIVARLGMTEFLIEEGALLPPQPWGELEPQSPSELGDLGGNGSDESPPFQGGFRGIEDLGGNGSDPPLPPFKRGELESESLPFQGGFRGISAGKLEPPDLPPQVYPVLRQDLAIALYGTSVQELLLQTCSFNFRALSLSDHPVVLTSMVGVSVTVIPGDRDGIPLYRIWCDGTFGAYFWETLVAIAQELGGGVIGVGQIQKMKEKRINRVSPG
ncbi:hypothetical protein H6G89_00565 [Oscillatoria sp. FACHB-1407]|uniref:hypothetical protein n=1 Tax=Oscillatoria sp. FACHB-1407 TaxID=2692847 RepID=UPI001684163D|nr:hypothetical protein [Oscillatoria sp. FACHB-1407]MBD2459523.1 hypothetical protein [Oscillatoria sp. FACHB-1407]